MKKYVVVKYGILSSTVSTILKNKHRIITAIKSGGISGSSKRLMKPTYKNVGNDCL